MPGDQALRIEEEFSQLLTKEDLAIPVAAIQVLLGVIKRSQAATMHGMDEELRHARDELVAACMRKSQLLRGRTTMSLWSGCELMMRHATRTFLEFSDFEQCKAELLKRGENFALQSRLSRERIADVGHPFVRDGSRVLVHGRSRVVLAVLCRAAETKHFSVLATKAEGEGDEAALELSKAGLPVNVVLDAAVGYFMETVDCVLLGAEGVVENGGIVNKIGTLVVATCANALNKPVYVAAEAYKFARLYPLKQRDLPNAAADPTQPCSNSSSTPTLAPAIDYTPPHYISLLFSNLGVLTPSAVSDELIRLYQ